MKKLFIAAIVILMLFGSTALALVLWSYVSYSTGGGVGPNRPVNVWYSTQSYDIVYTGSDSQYDFAFQAGT